MDEFFQRLREIQKKERSISGLADVGDNFYNDLKNYLNKLIKEIGNNPLSFYSYLNRDARRIAAEICERREHKIINSALLNIQRTQQLFNESSSQKSSNFPVLPPQNMTSEEEDLYYSITTSFSNYRKKRISPLMDYKAKQVSDSKVETTSEKHSESKVNMKDKQRKTPIGIEHDIESYQAYEIPELEEDQNIPQDILEAAPPEISRYLQIKRIKLKRSWL